MLAPHAQSLMNELWQHHDSSVPQYVRFVLQREGFHEAGNWLEVAKICYAICSLINTNPNLTQLMLDTSLCKMSQIPKENISYQRSLLESAQFILKITIDHLYNAEDLELVIKILIEAADDRYKYANTLKERYEQRRQYQYANSYCTRAIILLAKKPTNDQRFPQVVARFYEIHYLNLFGRISKPNAIVIEFLNTLTPADLRWRNAIEHMRKLPEIVTNGDRRLLENSWTAIRNLAKTTLHVADPDKPARGRKKKKRRDRKPRPKKQNPNAFFAQQKDRIVTLLRERINCKHICIAQLTLVSEVENSLRRYTATACIIPIDLETHCSLLYIGLNAQRICYLDALEKDMPVEVKEAIHEVYRNFDLTHIRSSPVTIPPKHTAANTELIIYLMEYYIKWNGQFPNELFLQVEYHSILENLQLLADEGYNTPGP
jgi:hypothetical protein